MWAEVVFTHLEGVPIARGEAHPRGSMEGEVQTYGVGPRAKTVVALRVNVQGPDVARLYGSKLIGIGPDVVRICGLERSGAAWVRQEWICFLKQRPREVPGEPTRDRRP